MKSNLKKYCIRIAVVALFVALSPTQPIHAGDGKMLIASYPWITPPSEPRFLLPPIVGHYIPTESEETEPNSLDEGKPIDPENSKRAIPVPTPPAFEGPIPGYDLGMQCENIKQPKSDVETAEVDGVDEGLEEDDDDSFGPDSTFFEPKQNAVIAWDGRKEVLILSTYDYSKTGKSNAMLSVVPLLGRPIKIEATSDDPFDAAKALIGRKLHEDLQPFPWRIKEVSSSNIFVLELDNSKDFVEQVQGYIARKYDAQAAALITPQTIEVLDFYFKKGFRYFAFDLTIVEKEGAIKKSIIYEFESKRLYFPLVASKIGGSGRTVVDLIVIAPGMMQFDSQYNYSNACSLIGNKWLAFNHDDLNAIDSNIADLLGNYGRVAVADFMTSNEINQFSDDLIMKKADW